MSFEEQFNATMPDTEHAFQITRKAKRQKVSVDTHPEIVEMTGEFDSEVPKTAVATHFFNRQNENDTYKYVSPWVRLVFGCELHELGTSDGRTVNVQGTIMAPEIGD